jgi:hypothetical protein
MGRTSEPNKVVVVDDIATVLENVAAMMRVSAYARSRRECCVLERDHRLLVGLLDGNGRLGGTRLGVALGMSDKAEDDTTEEVGEAVVCHRARQRRIEDRGEVDEPSQNSSPLPQSLGFFTLCSSASALDT